MTRPHPGTPFFEPIGDALGENYLRYSFTKGTEQEVTFLLELLGLPEGARVLDVGCGPGRHAIGLARAGMQVTGVDISSGFLEIAQRHAADAGVRIAFYKQDARELPFEDEFDAAMSICQGGFGLMGDDDSIILRRMMEALKPGGLLVVSAFSALFEASVNRPEAAFDVGAGVVHEAMTIKTAAGGEATVDAWTSVYTPRELKLLAIGVGLIPEEVWSVEPGDFARREPDLERPEFMLVARKPPR
ncbi:MAG TPA: class I SAM-dependent methyltransferase [Actinomycetota bacterium]|nr:class I SAM-dependent methyltransferase [Actinomycetota bacterium]